MRRFKGSVKIRIACSPDYPIPASPHELKDVQSLLIHPIMTDIRRKRNVTVSYNSPRNLAGTDGNLKLSSRLYKCRSKDNYDNI